MCCRLSCLSHRAGQSTTAAQGMAPALGQYKTQPSAPSALQSTVSAVRNSRQGGRPRAEQDIDCNSQATQGMVRGIMQSIGCGSGQHLHGHHSQGTVLEAGAAVWTHQPQQHQAQSEEDHHHQPKAQLRSSTSSECQWDRLATPY